MGAALARLGERWLPAGGDPAALATPAAPPAPTSPSFLDILGLVALNGYAREACSCAGLCRETWRCVPPGLSATDADRVRAGHPLWQAIIDLPAGPHRRTRLMCASVHNDAELVRDLCSWHAALELRDADGMTAMHLASRNGSPAAVRALAAAGASVSATVALCRGPTRDALGLTCDGAVASALIAVGAPAGGAALVQAAESGRLAVVQALLGVGVAADTTAPQSGGLTALIAAAARGHVAIMKALLAAGADPAAATSNGTTAVTAAGLYVNGHRDTILLALRRPQQQQQQQPPQQHKYVN